MITNRELSWITKGTHLAVTLHGHRYRGYAIEQVNEDTWEVDIGGCVHTCTRTGECTIEHLLGPPYATSNPAGSL